MRKRRRKSGLTAFGGVLAMSLLAGTRANAAQITFQLRPTSSTSIPNVAGTTVTFDVYAVIQNHDGNNADDGLLRVHTAIARTEAAGTGLLGDMVPLTLNTTQDDGSNGVHDG